MPFPLAIALILSATSGALLALPFTWLENSSTAWFALAPIFWLAVKAPTTRQAVLLAAVCFLTWANICFSFLWPVAFPGAIAASIYTASLYVLATLAVRRISSWGMANTVIGTAALWMIVEIVRAVIPVLAFPWLLMGHALADHDHLRQGADLLGVFGLSFIVVGVNACIAFALPRWLPERWRAIPEATVKSSWNTTWLFLLVGVGGAWFYGELRIEKIAPRLETGEPIAVIQGNVAQKLDRTGEQLQAQTDRHIELHRNIVARGRVEGAAPVLVCWAETMVPGFITEHPYGEQFRQQVRDSGVMTLAGVHHRLPPDPGDDEPLDHNAAMVVDSEGRDIATYFKRRLVPFGEYIPYGDRYKFLRVLRSVTRDQYRAGTEPSPIFEAGSYSIGINLCVEDVHPDLARECAWAGADTIINLTNDGWFYGTFGPLAHMRAAVWRSIEVRRPMLRVTNTGRTVVVNPLGAVTLLIPNETEGAALVHLQRIGPFKGAGEGDPLRTSAKNGSHQPVTLYMRLGEGGVFIIASLIFFACWYFAAKPEVNLPPAPI